MLKFNGIPFLTIILLTVTVNCLQLPNDLLQIPSTKIFFVKYLSDKIVESIVTATAHRQHQQFTSNNKGKATIIPPLPDLITIDPVKLSIDLTIDWDETSQIKVFGHLELTSPAELRGLGEMTNDLALTVIPLRPAEMRLRIDIPKLEITGQYDLVLNIDLITSNHTITGSGNLAASMENIFLDVFAKLKAAGNLAVLELALDLGFTDLTIDGDEGQVDGQFPIDWESVGNNLQTYFDTLWTNNEEVKEIITEEIRLIADNIVKDCTLAELIGGNTDCLNLPTLPPVETTTSVDTTTEQPGDTTTTDTTTTEGDTTTTTTATTTEGDTTTTTTTTTTEADTTTTESATTTSEGDSTSTNGETTTMPPGDTTTDDDTTTTEGGESTTTSRSTTTTKPTTTTPEVETTTSPPTIITSTPGGDTTIKDDTTSSTTEEDETSSTTEASGNSAAGSLIAIFFGIVSVIAFQ